jgi:hypothetical protein
MTRPASDTRLNPGDETIRLGPLAVRFLVTGENSNASVAAFELAVPASQPRSEPLQMCGVVTESHYYQTYKR